MPVDEDFYFAGDLSEADNDRTRLDHLERRLEVYLADMRQETERLRTVRRSWCQATFSQTVAHNTNTLPTLTMQYNRPGWSLASSNTQIIPTTPGFYRCVVFNTTAATMPVGSRFRTLARHNNTNQFGGSNQIPHQGNIEQTPASRIFFMNGTTDYANAFLYHFQGSGTASITMTGSILLELVDVNSAGA
jgi:hypothetical protein